MEEMEKNYCYVYYNWQHNGVQRVHRTHGQYCYVKKPKVHDRTVKANVFCSSLMIVKVELDKCTVDVPYYKSDNHPTNKLKQGYFQVCTGRSSKADMEKKLRKIFSNEGQGCMTDSIS